MGIAGYIYTSFPDKVSAELKKMITGAVVKKKMKKSKMVSQHIVDVGKVWKKCIEVFPALDERSVMSSLSSTISDHDFSKVVEIPDNIKMMIDECVTSKVVASFVFSCVVAYLS